MLISYSPVVLNKITASVPTPVTDDTAATCNQKKIPVTLKETAVR